MAKCALCFLSIPICHLCLLTLSLTGTEETPHQLCQCIFYWLFWKSNALFVKWLMFNCRAAGKPLFCSSCRVSWVIVKGQGSSELHVSGLITAIMNEFMTVPSSRSQGKHRSSLTTMAIMSFPINTPTTNLCDCHILCLFILKKRLICLDRILPSCIHCIVHDESRITAFTLRLFKLLLCHRAPLIVPNSC